MDCLRCGGIIKPTGKRGAQPKLCSIECRKAYRKEYLRAWEDAHRDEIREKRNAIRDKVRKWNREFYYRNRERRKEHARKIYAKCDKEANLETGRAWRLKNLELARAIGRRSTLARRARLKGAFVEAVDPRVVFDRDRGICQLCNAAIGESEWHIDHVIPLARGGTHEYSNVQLAHAKCNIAKGAKLIPRPA